MKLTAPVKLVLSDTQKAALLRTLETANDAANYVSEKAWNTGTFGQYALHTMCYHDVKQRFRLTAQVVVRVIAKVSDAYKLDRNTQRVFLRRGSIAYDSRILSWRRKRQAVSVWTVDGRIEVPFLAGSRQLELLKTKQGEADLAYRDGEFYLLQTCEVEEMPPDTPSGFLGVDFGVVNIAADSDGGVHSGERLNGLRKRYHKLRSKLQSKKTKATKRLLRKRRRKEQRFASHVNHCISKSLVAKAKDTGRGIALENLKGIRGRITVRKGQRRQHYSWAFSQLRLFIEYKAKRAGVMVALVDPRNTSRTCPRCGCVDKHNRPSQSVFLCVFCGFSAFADTNAAGIIASRATCKLAELLASPIGAG
jgi:IS605 OrfB family transposase